MRFLFKKNIKATAWIVLTASLLSSGCEQRDQSKSNDAATKRGISRQHATRLDQTKHGTENTRQSTASGLEKFRAERDRKLKETEVRQEKIQIAKVSFTSERPPEGVSIQGLSSPEPWGTWSIGKQVILRFDQPLPNRFKLVITARAYGPNAGKPFTLTLGKQMESMIFRESETVQEVEVNLKQSIDTITLLVPEPTSPADMNESADDRKLGIGVTRILLLRTTN